MELRRVDRGSAERRRRWRRRRLVLRSLLLLGCVAVVVLAVLLALRGCGSSGTGADSSRVETGADTIAASGGGASSVSIEGSSVRSAGRLAATPLEVLEPALEVWKGRVSLSRGDDHFYSSGEPSPS